MSDVVVILEKLKEEGFSLWLDGEKLRYKAPKESITKANLLTLKRNKEEIIQVLQNYSKRIVVAKKLKRLVYRLKIAKRMKQLPQEVNKTIRMCFR